MSDNSPSSIAEQHRTAVLALLIECSTLGQSSVPPAAIEKLRQETKKSFERLGDENKITNAKQRALLSKAEEEAVAMYPVEKQRLDSIMKAAATESTSIQNVQPAEATKSATTKSSSTKQIPIQQQQVNAISLPPPTDEHDFTSPPYFSSSNSLHSSLSRLDLSYRCSICGDLYQTPVAVLPCLHTFCSECIRRHCKFGLGGMRRECKCPECNQLIGNTRQNYENQILPNHHFANQIDNYKSLREELRSALARLGVYEQQRQAVVVDNNNNNDITESEDVNGVAVKRNNDEMNKKKEEDNGKRLSRACTNRGNKKTRYAEDSDISDDGDDDDNNDDDVNYIPNNDKSNTTIQQPPHKKPKIALSRKTPTSYHGLKRKKLIELCSKEGLPTNGSDEELKKRHSDYITLYNSECDAEYPRSGGELVMEIRRRENGRKKEASLAMQNGAIRHESYMNKLMRNVEIRGKGGTATLTSGDTAFDATLNNGFKALIQRHKANSNGGRAGKENSNITAAGSDGSSTDALNGTNVTTSPSSNDTSATESIPEESTSPSTTTVNTQTTKSIPASTSKAASIQKQPTSTPKPPHSHKKKSPSSAACPTSRIINAGPWKCTRCTYYNERNTTVKARCEMCDAAREKSAAKNGVSVRGDVEVIDIDC
eukprot:scaffold5916_cov44-Cyclotella_meneghiniana.AAC.14